MTPEFTSSLLRPRERRDQLLLLGAFFAGMLGTLAVKALSAHPLVVTLVPVCVIVAYAVLAWRNAKTALEPDMIGDNCYYLGFILTLVSLAWTLYAVSQAPDDLDLVREIISGFGVALSSTITGIFMRAFFLQLRPDVVTAERIARQEVIEATRVFRAELEQSVKDLKGFSVGVQQALGEHHETLKTSSAAALNAHRDWMRQFTIDTAKEAAILHKTAVEDWIKTTKQAADDTTAAFVVTLTTSQGQLADLMTQSEQRLEKLYDAVDAKTKKTLAHIDKVGSSADKVATQVEVAGAALATRIAGAATRFAEETTTVTGRIAAFGTDLDRSIGDSIVAMKTASNDLAATMTHATGTAGVAARNASDGWASTLLQSARTISTASVKAGAEIDASVTELAKAGGTIRSAAVSLTGISKRVVRLSSLLDEVETKLSAENIGRPLKEHRVPPSTGTRSIPLVVETQKLTPTPTDPPAQAGTKPEPPVLPVHGVPDHKPHSRFGRFFGFGKKGH